MSIVGQVLAGHVHTPADGRGRRLVTVDGIVVNNVVYADTRKGVVRHYDSPPKMHKRGKRPIERTRHGKVAVEFI